MPATRRTKPRGKRPAGCGVWRNRPPRRVALSRRQLRAGPRKDVGPIPLPFGEGPRGFRPEAGLGVPGGVSPAAACGGWLQAAGPFATGLVAAVPEGLVVGIRRRRGCGGGAVEGYSDGHAAPTPRAAATGTAGGRGGACRADGIAEGEDGQPFSDGGAAQGTVGVDGAGCRRLEQLGGRCSSRIGVALGQVRSRARRRAPGLRRPCSGRRRRTRPLRCIVR